jgi:hypothetical protein
MEVTMKKILSIGKASNWTFRIYIRKPKPFNYLRKGRFQRLFIGRFLAIVWMLPKGGKNG